MSNDGTDGIYIEERPEHWVFCCGNMSVTIHCKPSSRMDAEKLKTHIDEYVRKATPL